ncbi:hypothetical protein PVK06_005342 [Gossypium arboreum]|uniref:Uncharacterized protein n=1 Tax=Gossypium arboreum TaxID=29729 RepID=A0ABR0QUC5_GOSAR|nr:hypothetical protein PVK06_005342 [Gossypium arboreum]
MVRANSARKGRQHNYGYVSELSDYTHISVTQNNIQELKEIWDQWGNETKQLFYDNYKDLPYLFDIQLLHFWEVDLVPTVEEYTALLRCPRAFGYVDEATTDLFHRLSKRVTSAPAILAETFRSLSACRRASASRFIGHFRLIDGIVCQVFFENDSPVKDIVASSRKVDMPKENWIVLLRNLQSEDVEWRAPWMVPATHGLAQSEFVYRGADYKRKVSEVSSAWNKTWRLKGVAINPATTSEYVEWRSRRINDNVPMTKMEEVRPMEEYLQVIPSELDIMKQEFKRKNLELGKKIEKLEEEKMYLSLDVDLQKKEIKKVRKEKRKIEKDRDDLKEEYKKAQVSLNSHMKTCHNVVRAFDGTEWKVMGRIDIPLEIGPNTYEVDFLVMDIRPSYNCLLEWCPPHCTKKLKLVTDGRLITINADEDIIAAVTRKAPYVEANKEAIECSFHSLEIINATFILEGSEVPKMSRATRMALQMMMGKGALSGKGLGRQLQGGVQIPKLIEKKDRFGLGFKPDHKHRRQEIEKCQVRRKTRLNGGEVEWEPMTFPPISKSFKSGGLLVEESHQVSAVHNEGLEQGSLEGIRPYEPGSSLYNWTTEDLPVVSRNFSE